MKYSEAKSLSEKEMEQALSGSDPEKICEALLSVAHYDSDWRHAQNICLAYLDHPNPDVRGLAATCLGHIARIHGKLDKEKILSALEHKLNDPDIGGQASDAIDDIAIFIP